MEELKQRILKEGAAKKDGDIVLVGSFLNHQLDPQLMMHCAEEFARLFADQGINYHALATITRINDDNTMEVE